MFSKPSLPVSGTVIEALEEPQKVQYEFGDMYVKFEDSSTSFLVYNGDIDVQRMRKTFNENIQIPHFEVVKGYDNMMKNGISSTISTTHQLFLTGNFEELRETFYQAIVDKNDVLNELDHLQCYFKEVRGRLGLNDNHVDDGVEDNLDGVNVEPMINSNATPDFFSLNQLFQVATHLLMVKKRSLAALAMNLEEPIEQMSKMINKLCHSAVWCTEREEASVANEMAQDDEVASGPGPLTSEVSLDVGQESQENVFAGTIIDRHDLCLHCSLLVNLFKTLKKLQESLDVGLNVCESLESILKDLRGVLSLNFSFGKRFKEASLAELRCALLLSSQILKLQIFQGNHLNKIHTLLMSLHGAKTDTQETRKMSMAASAEESLTEELDKEKEVESDECEERPVMTDKDEESCDHSPSNVCQLSSNFHAHIGIPGFRQFLDTFVQYMKIVKQMEKPIVQVVSRVLEKEEINVPKSLDTISETYRSESFPKETIVLKHYRNPFDIQAGLAKTSDVLKQRFSGTRKIVLPHGEGRLSTVDRRSVIYEGTWKKGKRDGFGKAFVVFDKLASFWLRKNVPPSSTIGEYTGNWTSNARHGFGHMVYSGGSVYDGEWSMDQIHGHGVLKRFDGCILEGFWRNGNASGCMTFTWPHGATEYREYKQGNVLRVYDPRHNLSSSLKTLKSIECEREEKLYYKDCLKTCRRMFDEFKVNCEEFVKESIAQERKEKSQIVNSLEGELRQSQKWQRDEARKMEDLRRQLDCILCMNQPKDCILLPCLHFNCCHNCILELKHRETVYTCPTCRVVINGELHCKLF